MYLYYDSNNALQEVINDVFLHEVDSSNSIYVYSENWPDLTTSAPTLCTLTLKRPDGTYTNLHTSVIHTDEIPYDSHRDLRFFSYNKDYSFFEFDLSNVGANSDLTVAGLYFGNPIIVSGSMTTVLNAVTFNVGETSISPDAYITQSQYAYILQLFSDATAYTNVPMTANPLIVPMTLDSVFSYRIGMDCVLFGSFSVGTAISSDAILATALVYSLSSTIVGFAKGSDGSDCEVWAVQNGSMIELHCIGASAGVTYRFSLSGKAI